jgi:hypothetical protein
MLRTLFVIVLAFAASAGCRMCASPYDYCGPVYSGNCRTCDRDYRLGSRFTDNANVHPTSAEQVIEETPASVNRKSESPTLAPRESLGGMEE